MKSKVILFFLLFINCGNSFDENKLLETQKWLASLKEPKHYSLEELKQIKSFTTPEQYSEPGKDDFIIQENDFKFISNLKNLERLIFLDGYTSDNALEQLKGLQKIKSIKIYKTKITDKGIKILNNFKELDTIAILNSNITDKGIYHLSKNKKLKILFIASFGTEANFNTEKFEDMFYTHRHDKITDRCIEYLIKMPNLKAVFLWDTKITANGIERLQKNKNLFISYVSDDYPKLINKTSEFLNLKENQLFNIKLKSLEW